jgi:hypothetical protein
VRPWILIGVLAASCLFTPKVARADFVYEVNLTGLESFGGLGVAQNDWTSITLFPFAKIVSVQWVDLEFNTENGSFRDELTLRVQDNAALLLDANSWDDNPAAGFASEGTYRGSGTFLDPGPLGGGPFNLLADGVLVVSVYEVFDDDGEAVRDAVITDGKLVVRATAVPEPSSMVMVSVVGVAAIAHRRLRRNRMRRNRMRRPSERLPQ